MEWLGYESAECKFPRHALLRMYYVLYKMCSLLCSHYQKINSHNVVSTRTRIRATRSSVCAHQLCPIARSFSLALRFASADFNLFASSALHNVEFRAHSPFSFLKSQRKAGKFALIIFIFSSAYLNIQNLMYKTFEQKWKQIRFLTYKDEKLLLVKVLWIFDTLNPGWRKSKVENVITANISPLPSAEQTTARLQHLKCRLLWASSR